MNQAYLAQFDDSNLKDLLVSKDNIPPIEFLLELEGQQLQRLQELEQAGKLDFGPRTKRRDLSSLFSEVKDEVDCFLDASGIAMPKHKYFSFLSLDPENITKSAFTMIQYLGGALALEKGIYAMMNTDTMILSRGISFALLGLFFVGSGRLCHYHFSQPQYSIFESITLAKEKRVKLIPTMAHEYTHYIQDRGIRIKENPVFIEGHARGVERKISQNYREREDNEAFLYQITDETFGELKSAYLWICKKLGVSPKKNLVDKKSSRDIPESLARFLMRNPSPHAIGNTLFYLHEAQKGSGIYEDMLKGTFRLEQ